MAQFQYRATDFQGKIVEGSNPLSYESPSLLLQDPLSKTRTQVITSPSVSVQNTTARIAPVAWRVPA